MDKLRAMEVFVRIVDAGSLTGAADALDMSVPSVVRSLATLERVRGTGQAPRVDDPHEHLHGAQLVHT